MLQSQIGQNAAPSSITRSSTTAAANTAVAKTLAAVTGLRHILHGIQWSYSAAPTGGKLTVEDAVGTTIFEIDITAGGPNNIDITLHGSINTAMVITLAAGGAGITGKLNIQSTVYPS